MSEETTTQKLTPPTGLKTKYILELRRLPKSEDPTVDTYKLLADWLGVSYEDLMNADAAETGPLLGEFISRAEKSVASLPKAKSS